MLESLIPEWRSWECCWDALSQRLRLLCEIHRPEGRMEQGRTGHEPGGEQSRAAVMLSPENRRCTFYCYFLTTVATNTVTVLLMSLHL